MSKVVIQECKDYSIDNLTQKINYGIERIGGWDKFIHSGDIVLLKVLVLQAMISLQIDRDT